MAGRSGRSRPRPSEPVSPLAIDIAGHGRCNNAQDVANDPTPISGLRVAMTRAVFFSNKPGFPRWLLNTLNFKDLTETKAANSSNTQQRFQTYLDARRRDFGYRGSMIFAARHGVEYLLRDYYDPKSGVKRQRSKPSRS